MKIKFIQLSCIIYNFASGTLKQTYKLFSENRRGKIFIYIEPNKLFLFKPQELK